MAQSEEIPIDQQLWELWQEFAERMIALVLARKGGPNPDEPVTKSEVLSALNANYALVEGLKDYRWFVIQLAKEMGASWAQIGTAMGGMSKQGASDYFRRRILAEDVISSPFYDADRVNGVLRDHG